jgi:hypothetical protein
MILEHVRLIDWRVSMKMLRRITTAIGLLLWIFTYVPGHAQAPGYAEILAPHGGEAIQGVYTIKGSASHPAFIGYQLSFAYSEDPTGTWFLLGDRQDTPIIEGGLGLWDTTGITDGDYRLRLEVYLENDNLIVAIVEGVRIRNHSLIETETPAPIAAQVTATSIPPTKTPRPTPIPLTPVRGSTQIQRALIIGAIIGFIFLSGFGLYLFIRRSARQRWGMMQMRQILRDQARKQDKRNP